MKKALFVLIAVALVTSLTLAQRRNRPNAPFATGDALGKKTYHVSADGADREFIVYRPIRLAANAKVPVVFVFHPTAANGAWAYQHMGWKEKADSEGFMVVFPTALKYHLFQDELVQKGEVVQNVTQYVTKWYHFRLPNLLDPKFPNQKLYDDVKFVQAIVASVKQNYQVDTSRFYATGFSNGAQFTVRLVVQMSDVFAAFAPCGAGAIEAENMARTNEYTTAPFTPRPVSHLVGELDAKLTHPLDIPAFPMDESLAAPDSATKIYVITGFLTLLKLKDQYVYHRTPRISHFRYNQPLDAGAPRVYDITIAKGMGHTYPNGKNYPLKAVDLFWPFMQKYKL
ncbi:MAG TPA: hypothetical protein VFZ34_33490 [Blastocatellia bacterium]|nr:hypothetical protein [Blastocatellia bacterium]